MKRALHQAIVFFGILLVVTLVRLPYGSYRETILPWAREAATPQGITLDFADITLKPPVTMLLEKLNMLIPVQRFPIPVNIESASLSLRPLSLLRLHASGDGEIKLYQGTVTYDFIRPVLGKTLESSGSFTNISLAAHPVLGSFGLSGMLEGEYSGLFSQDQMGNYLPEKGDLSIALRNAAFLGGVKIMQLIPIPEVQNASLVAQAVYDPTVITLSSLSFDSSVASFSGKGRIRRRTLSLLGEGKISGVLKLTDQGKPLFGPYLALAAHVPVDNPAADWDVDVSFDSAGRPLASVQPRNG